MNYDPFREELPNVPMDLLFLRDNDNQQYTEGRGLPTLSCHRLRTLSLGRMTNTEYILHKQTRESIQSCTVRRKPLSGQEGSYSKEASHQGQGVKEIILTIAPVFLFENAYY